MNFRNTRPPPPATPQIPLDRQLSVYSLTFDEFQNTLGGPGKDYGSMNMDEFLRNIWTAEESQAMASAFGGPSSAPNTGSAPTASSAAALQRQGSLTLPRTLSQKTVDEVWRDCLRESELPQLQQQQQRQPTLGEITLEEFLVRAGVVREEIPQQPVEPVKRPVISNNNNGTNTNTIFGELPNSNSSGLGLGFTQSTRPANTTAAMVVPYPAPPLDLGTQQGMRGGIGDPGMGNGLLSGIVDLGGGCGVTVAAIGSPDGIGKGNGDLSSLSPVPFSWGRNRSGVVEKVVERRQRRMIKNRESAARSRARKQAYTMELEAEVAKLKEQNEELQRKQEEIMEIQKIQVMEMINQQRGPKKMCLRRTRTGPW